MTVQKHDYAPGVHDSYPVAPGNLPMVDVRVGCTIRRGENTFIGGSPEVTAKLVHSIIFRSLVQSGGCVLWIDGGNSFDPYEISELAGRCGYDARDLLSRIRIARAFTAHQMEAISRSAAHEAAGCSISAVAVTSVAELFTGDVKWKEGVDLLRSTVRNITAITENYRTITVMTSCVQVSSSAEMESIISGNCARVVNVGMEYDDLTVESDGVVMTVNRWDGSRHQRSLLEFMDRGK